MTEKSTLESTRSLRPKEFKRKTLLDQLNRVDDERFHENALATLHTGNLKNIHVHCNLHAFERTKYKADRLIRDLEKEDEERMIQERTDYRDNLLNKSHTLKEENTKYIQDMTQKWKQTQLVKKNRMIRDLHYELAQLTKQDLTKLHATQVHRTQEENGIVDFEKNMKRLGIGSGEGAEMAMTVSYETTDNYEERIQQIAKQQFPTNEEVNNFKTQLKERTETNRLARYEKARRKRRAMVEQAAMAASKSTSTM